MSKKLIILVVVILLVLTSSVAYAETVISNQLSGTITAKSSSSGGGGGGGGGGGSGTGQTDTPTTDDTVDQDSNVVQPPTPEPSPALSDIADHWAESDIVKLIVIGAIKGYPDGRFYPDSSITRAEFATVLAKAMGWEENPNAVQFTDTVPAWAKGYVGAAVQRGIIKGYPNNTFGPQKPITRAEMAVMVALTMKLNSQTPPSFKDNSNIPTWAKSYVGAVASQGIIKGKPGNVFAPNDFLTRAETAAIMARMLEL